MAPPGIAYLTFQGVGTKRRQYFSALCGEKPPTPTSGYAKWGTIDRPLYRGVTVLQGYDPAQMEVNLRFGMWRGEFGFPGWDTSNPAGQRLRQDIDILGWMAGENFGSGRSPIVYMTAFGGPEPGGLHQSDLIPYEYWGMPWVINGGIEWGDAIRNGNGYRVYQEAKFTLLQYNTYGAAPPRVDVARGYYFKTTGWLRTARSIAASLSAHSPAAYQDALTFRILTSGANNPMRGTRIFLRRRSGFWQMPVGRWIWIPSHEI